MIVVIVIIIVFHAPSSLQFGNGEFSSFYFSDIFLELWGCQTCWMQFLGDIGCIMIWSSQLSNERNSGCLGFVWKNSSVMDQLGYSTSWNTTGSQVGAILNTISVLFLNTFSSFYINTLRNRKSSVENTKINFLFFQHKSLHLEILGSRSTFSVGPRWVDPITLWPDAPWLAQ